MTAQPATEPHVYKYLIINLEDGEVHGTDDVTIADHASEYETYVVIHRELCLNIMSGTCHQIKPVDPSIVEND